MCPDKTRLLGLIKDLIKKHLICASDLLNIGWILSPNTWFVAHILQLLFHSFSAISVIAFEMQSIFALGVYELYVPSLSVLKLFLSNLSMYKQNENISFYLHYYNQSLQSSSGLHAKHMGFTNKFCLSLSSSSAIN